MITLTPTVHERLARCGTSVRVDGLVAGADVTLWVDGTEHKITASGGGHTFTVPPLAAGAVVKAMQTTAMGASPWSPEVVVEDAAVPPAAGPRLPETVGVCSHCVQVEGLVPGSRVELWLGNDLVGEGTADIHGSRCVHVDLKHLGGDPQNQLRGRMVVCGSPGPESLSPVVLGPALPAPRIPGPLFGCQGGVTLDGLRQGARVQIESDDGTGLGTFCSCWSAVLVGVARPLRTTERVRARQILEGTGGACHAQGAWCGWEPVVPPDERIKPRILEALVEGDRYLRVDNQIAGATLLIKIAPAEGQTPAEYGPRPASPGQPIALNEPLAKGSVVTVNQSLCGFSIDSDPVPVEPLPDQVVAPVVVPPLFACGAAVQVSNLHPGAFVRIYLDDIPVGGRWAGVEGSVSVAASPSLVAGGKVTARQWAGGMESPPSEPVDVEPLGTVQAPRILQPVAFGDTEVWVSRVTPGARVSIRSSGNDVLGETDASETIVRVPVSPVAGPVRAVARLCSQTTSGGQVEPVDDPCGPGPFARVGEEFRSLGSWKIPQTEDGDAFEMQIEGQLYFPATPSGTLDPDAGSLPLVAIAHGFFGEIGSNPAPPSHLGYDYLARHLASWGMLVFSVDMTEVNRRSWDLARPHQYARGEIVLRAASMLIADPALAGRIDSGRIGLVGHSMAGEGVVAAQFLNERDNRGYGIRGVVSIAPTRYRPELRLRGPKYMQILGSMDLLLWAATGSDAAAQHSGFRIYDTASRPKTHFWVHGARHNPFNRVWVAEGDRGEETRAGLSLPPADHERIAKCLVNAFFQDALLDRAAYAGYMEGTVLPRSLHGLEIHPQHSGAVDRTVIDNFGDEDAQLGIAAEPLDPASNTRNGTVNAGGTGLVDWEDVEHVDLSHSPHNTKGGRVSWGAPGAFYLSETGGVARIGIDVLSLRLAQLHPDALNPLAEPLDLFVTLGDGSREATVRLGSVARVPYPDAAMDVLCPMRTVRIPLDSFLAANPLLSLGSLQSVTLRLAGRATGNVLFDDIELSR